jgi:hypothetical protein
MSGFLDRLVERAQGQARVAQPLVPSYFAPLPWQIDDFMPTPEQGPEEEPIPWEQPDVLQSPASPSIRATQSPGGPTQPDGSQSEGRAISALPELPRLVDRAELDREVSRRSYPQAPAGITERSSPVASAHESVEDQESSKELSRRSTEQARQKPPESSFSDVSEPIEEIAEKAVQSAADPVRRRLWLMPRLTGSRASGDLNPSDATPHSSEPGDPEDRNWLIDHRLPESPRLTETGARRVSLGRQEASLARPVSSGQPGDEDTLRTRPARGPEAVPFEGVRRSAPSPPAPTVQVTIGRVEVRALTPPAPQQLPGRSRRDPQLSLEEYLKRRNGGGL